MPPLFKGATTKAITSIGKNPIHKKRPQIMFSTPSYELIKLCKTSHQKLELIKLSIGLSRLPLFLLASLQN